MKTVNLRVASSEKATDPGAGMDSRKGMDLRAAEYYEKGMDLRVEAFSRCDSVLTEVGAYSEENTDLSLHDKDSLRVVNHQVIVSLVCGSQPALVVASIYTNSTGRRTRLAVSSIQVRLQEISEGPVDRAGIK